MPNVIIETSHNNLITQPDKLLARINEALWQSGQFKQQSDIKTRLYTPDKALVGLASGGQDGFIVVTFYLMPGRDGATLTALTEQIVAAIKAHVSEFEAVTKPAQLQIAVNPIELSAYYQKTVV